MTDRPDVLYDVVRKTFPNADIVWPFGDSALIEWLDGHIVATPDDEGDGTQFLVCIYGPGDWINGDDPIANCIVHGIDNVAELFDDLTEQPEGVNWAAWAVQWLADASADGRIKGFVS